MYDSRFDNDSFREEEVIHISTTKPNGRPIRIESGFFHSTADSFRECYLTFILIAANVIVYLIQTATQYRDQYGLLTDRITEFGACSWPDVIGKGHIWRLVSCMFIHGSWGHLIGNMAVLILCGFFLERILYRNCYLILYFAGGLGASLVSMIYHHFMPVERTVRFLFYEETFELYDVRSVGASGAIAALFAGLVIYLVFFGGFGNGEFSKNGYIWFLIAYIVISILSSIFSYQEGVDMAGHMGGLIFGCMIFFIYALIAYRDQKA